MISPCFVKQAGDGDNFSLLAIHGKSIQSLKFEKAIIIFAFVKDLRLLKIISFVMLVNVDNFELFVEKAKIDRNGLFLYRSGEIAFIKRESAIDPLDNHIQLIY